MPELKQRSDVELQTSPLKETSSQQSGPDTEPLLKNQTGNTPVQCLNDSQKSQPKIQENNIHTTASHSGDENISPPKVTTLQTCEG